MNRGFAIDCLPESAARYRGSHAIVVVDVFRATTVMVSAVIREHEVYPVGTLADARRTARRLRAPILMGEQDGVTPTGFDLTNSPAAVDSLRNRRPIVLLSSAGTLLLTECRGAQAVYVACLRNARATAEHLARHQGPVAIIGAGTRGEPRPEDQMVCAWIGGHLKSNGFEPENERSMLELQEWEGTAVARILESPSVAWLRETGQERDVEFVMEHIDDVPAVAVYDGRQVSTLRRLEPAGVRDGRC